MSQPPEIPDDLVGEDSRCRLTASAAKTVVRVFTVWGVGNGEASALLGVSEATFEHIKAGRWDGVLSQDQLTRASAVIAIFRSLHLLFADSMADRWPSLHNSGPIFMHQSPIALMIAGGIPRMIETREYIETLLGGSSPPEYEYGASMKPEAIVW